MWLLLTVSFARADAWLDQLGQTWALTEGWPSSQMTLQRPTPDMPPDDWIGLVFRPDGTIGFEALRGVDPSEGCSRSFAGFHGTWRRRGDRVQVKLVERTRGGTEHPASLVVSRIEPELLVLQPSP